MDLLKTEMSVLASKISSVIDTLWKVRTASISLWSAVLSVGLGSFSAAKEPVVSLLVLGCFLPILFINIDARNNRWYRRLSNREYAIQQYLNVPSEDPSSPFPVYDLAGDNTFRGSRQHVWEFSLLRSLVDPIPLTFYGGQLLFSAVVCTLYLTGPWRVIFLPCVFLTLLVVGILVFWSKRHATRQTERAKAQPLG